MIAAGLPENERERLAVLDEYDLLDTAEESTYDAFTALAREIAGTPISLISLVDENRTWFKSHSGLQIKETPRDQAFCSYVVANGKAMVVGDAQKDARFQDNPLVTGEPHLRFYAGVPLTTPQGLTVGTLCVLDTKPQQLNASQLQMLELLASALMNAMDGRRHRRKGCHDRFRLSRGVQAARLFPQGNHGDAPLRSHAGAEYSGNARDRRRTAARRRSRSRGSSDAQRRLELPRRTTARHDA
jgi:GAF domain-containing protein